MKWQDIARFILKNKLLLFITLLILSCFFAYKASSVRISYEGSRVLPTNDPSYVYYNQFKQRFGEDGSVMVIGIQSNKIFSLDTYQGWSRLTSQLRKVKGVKDVLSITHYYDLVKDSAKRRLVAILSDKKPISQTSVDSVKEKFNKLPFYEGFLYNKDTHTTLIAVSLDKNTLNTESRNRLVHEVLAYGHQFSVESGVSVHFSGLPYIRTIVAEKIIKEFFFLLALTVLATSLFLLLFYKNFYSLVIPLFIVALGVIWSLGFMALFAFKITLLNALIPPIIVVIGLPNSILLLNKYFGEYQIHQNRNKALLRTIEQTGFTTFIANITTAIGFGVFYFTKSELLSQFGIIAFLGILATYLLSVVLVPFFFSFLPSPKPPTETDAITNLMDRWLYFLNNAVNGHRSIIYVATMVLVTVSLIGLSRMKVNGYMVDDLPKQDRTYTDLKFFETYFKGVLPLEVCIDTRKKNGARSLSLFSKIDTLEKKVYSEGIFSKAISINQFIKFSKQGYYNGDTLQYALPDASEAGFLFGYLKEKKLSAQLVNNYVDSTGRRVRVSFQMADVGSKKTEAILKRINLEIPNIFPKDRYTVNVTGTSVLFIEGTDYLVKNLLQSLVLAIVLIAAIMFILFKTPQMVLISLLPNLIPLLITAGIMGFTGMALKPSTILIFSIAFGLASDQTIYFLTRFRDNPQRTPSNLSEKIWLTFGQSGKSMIFTAILLFCGFSVFEVSQFGGTVSLGILISVTILFSILSNLLLLPSMILSLRK